MLRDPRKFLATLFFVLPIACGPQDRAGPREEILNPSADISEADRRAARLLSLSSANSLASDSSDPYVVFVSCAASIDMLGIQVESRQLISAQDRRSLATAADIYRRRAQQLGRTDEMVARDIAKAKASDISQDVRARTAVACLRRLV